MIEKAGLFVPRNVSDLIAESCKSRIELVEEASMVGGSNQIYGVYYSGEGEIAFRNKNVYKGDIHRGMLHGTGSMVFADGTLYEGCFEWNQITGEGLMEWIDGSSYAGIFLNGVRHGTGLFKNPVTGVTYQGDWVHGKREGFGKLTLSDG